MKQRVYDPGQPYYAPTRGRFGRSRRVLAQNFLVALIWPFFAAVVHVWHFPRRRFLYGFVVFCGFAGLVFIPWPGSDAHFYMLRFEDFRAGVTSLGGEPVPMAIIGLVAWLDFDARWYFALVGLLYGLVVATAARLLFRDISRDVTLSLAAVVFVAAFFLNHPVFSALNARYHLALWVLVLATLLSLDGRWKHALAVAAFGTMIHFGHVLFSLALVILLLSRRLGPWQIFFAYAALAVAFVLPDSVFVSIGDFVAQTVGGGAFGEKIGSQVQYAERAMESGAFGRGGERAWFVSWASMPIFWSLMLTGHFLFWRLRKKREDPLYQLWILIILMWALQFAMSGVPEGTGRVNRNAIALLLLWHARWFLVRKEKIGIVLMINTLPFLFYFVVSYRIWLHQASVGTFLPALFGVWPDLWPTVMGLLGFD